MGEYGGPNKIIFNNPNIGQGAYIINGKLVRAKNLVNDDTILIKEMGKHKVYNVLLNKYDKMMVNNMIVETLNPKDNPLK